MGAYAWQDGTPHWTKATVLPDSGFDGRGGTDRVVGRCDHLSTNAFASVTAPLLEAEEPPPVDPAPPSDPHEAKAAARAKAAPAPMTRRVLLRARRAAVLMV